MLDQNYRTQFSKKGCPVQVRAGTGSRAVPKKDVLPTVSRFPFFGLIIALFEHRPIWKSGEFRCSKIGRFQNRGTFNFTTPFDDPLFEIGRFEKAPIASPSIWSFWSI